MENESRELLTYEGFIYTLEMTSKTWYTYAELRQWAKYCESLTKQVAHTFQFAYMHPTIDTSLQTGKGSIVDETPNKESNSHQYNATIQQYILTRDPDDDSTNINRLESEGTWEVKGSSISSDQFLQPLKIKEVHIESPKNPKFPIYRRLLGWWSSCKDRGSIAWVSEPIPYQLLRNEGNSGRLRGDENTPVTRC